MWVFLILCVEKDFKHFQNVQMTGGAGGAEIYLWWGWTLQGNWKIHISV